MARVFVPPRSFQGRWVRVVTCKMCAHVVDAAKNERPNDRGGTQFDSVGRNPHLVVEPCPACGHFGPVEEGETKIYFKHLILRTGYYHPADGHWWDPRTWFRPGRWELKDLPLPPKPPFKPEIPEPEELDN